MKRVCLLLCLAASSVLAEPFSFGVFGDTPYTSWERENLPDLIAEMEKEDLAFLIHDGDIKNSSSPCNDEVYRDILGVFQKSKHPLVYVVGDNEWTDCHRKNSGYDPRERLAYLRRVFFDGDRALGALGQKTLRLERQSRDAAFADYRENVRWERGGILFVGLHVVGSENNYYGVEGRDASPSAEFIERSAANRVWLAQAFAHAREKKLAGILIAMQANPGFEAANAGHPSPGFRDFLIQLREETQSFAGQVALVHGDTHRYQVNQPMQDPKTRQVVANFTRVETFGSPFFGWVKATADPSSAKVFGFSARPWRAPPATP